MTNAKRKPVLTTRELATVAILAAISAVLFMIEIPVVLFYKLDLSHLPVLLGTFAMGPVPGTLILLVKSLLGLLHSSSQGVGELADFLMGADFLLPDAFHKFCRNFGFLHTAFHILDKSSSFFASFLYFNSLKIL